MFTQGAALGYVIVGLSARLRPHYQFYRTAIPRNRIRSGETILQRAACFWFPHAIPILVSQSCTERVQTAVVIFRVDAILCTIRIICQAVGIGFQQSFNLQNLSHFSDDIGILRMSFA